MNDEEDKEIEIQPIIDGRVKPSPSDFILPKYAEAFGYYGVSKPVWDGLSRDEKAARSQTYLSSRR